MTESRPRPAPWLIAALKKRAQEAPQPEPEEEDQLFGIFEQLGKEPQECGT